MVIGHLLPGVISRSDSFSHVLSLSLWYLSWVCGLPDELNIWLLDERTQRRFINDHDSYMKVLLEVIVNHLVRDSVRLEVKCTFFAIYGLDEDCYSAAFKAGIIS